ncbi:MAG: response regulator [Chloroflexi bacterium]|nr:response regulator [Chloroflexota bacterium]
MPRVLIIDDDPVIRLAIEQLLTDYGYDTVTAADGESALKHLVQDAHFDAVLCDIKMPGLDGLSLLGQLQTRAPHLAVVMLTGEDKVETAVQAMRQGAINYLTKPIDPDDLLKAVQEAATHYATNLQKQAVLDQLFSNLETLRTLHPDLQQPEPAPPTETAAVPPDAPQIRCGALSVDRKQMLAYCGDDVLDLTPTEFDILWQLVQQQGHVIALEVLVLALHGVEVSREEARRMLSSHLSNLKTKLQKTPCGELLTNHWGRGYRLGEGRQS